jgi:hypothetical protein
VYRRPPLQLQQSVDRRQCRLRFVEAANSAAYVPITYPFDPAKFPGQRLYPLAPCPQEALLVMEWGPAMRLSKEWEKELKSRRQTLERQRKEAGLIRQELAGLEARQKPLLDRFDAAFPETKPQPAAPAAPSTPAPATTPPAANAGT